MDELCDLFSSQNLWCSEENTRKLISSLETTQQFLRETQFDLRKLELHIRSCKKRYEDYYNKLARTRSFHYLKLLLQQFISYGETQPEITQLLCLTYTIDCEILFSIGMLSIE